MGEAPAAEGWGRRGGSEPASRPRRGQEKAAPSPAGHLCQGGRGPLVLASPEPGSLLFTCAPVFPPQAVSPLPRHCDKGHLGPQSAVARGEDRCSHPHGGCVLPLGAHQQRGPVREAGGARQGTCRRGRRARTHTQLPDPAFCSPRRGGSMGATGRCDPQLAFLSWGGFLGSVLNVTLQSREHSHRNLPELADLGVSVLPSGKRKQQFDGLAVTDQPHTCTRGLGHALA